MITVSTDKSQLNITFIHNFTKTIYWAAPRTLEDVQLCVDSSLCFGIYLNGEQIGFARVITDYVVFAYLMDVFIDEKFRGNGYSSILIEAIMKEPALCKIKIWRLATTDAHFLYRKFGFQSLAYPEKLMEKVVL